MGCWYSNLMWREDIIRQCSRSLLISLISFECILSTEKLGLRRHPAVFVITYSLAPCPRMNSSGLQACKPLWRDSSIRCYKFFHAMLIWWNWALSFYVSWLAGRIVFASNTDYEWPWHTRSFKLCFCSILYYNGGACANIFQAMSMNTYIHHFW